MERRRLMMVVLGFCLGLSPLLALTPLLAQPTATTIRLTDFKLLDLSQIRLSQAVRLQEFTQVMTAKNVPPEKVRQYSDSFQKLPADLQVDLLAQTSPNVAGSAGMVRMTDRFILDRTKLDLILLFRIDSIWPGDGGAVGGWGYAMGSGFSGNCEVKVDGTAVETHYLEYSEFFPRALSFKIPAGATRGTNHNIVARNKVSNSVTPNFVYKLVAPRGYRGYWGWQFANFGWASIPWEMYRDYFGAAAVQYGDGTHRPAAQSWFNNAYTTAGQGGNCYGMSVSSLRFKNHALNTYWHGWMEDPANIQPYLWFYPWRMETRQTVQEDQGAWYTQEVLDTHTDLYNNQDHRECFDRAASLVTQVSNRPVLVIWAPTWGHAMVPYKTEVAGDSRRIIVYDNNNPYRENEGGSVDPSVATVGWAAKTFSYGGANKAVCMSYQECTPATPHLPGAEYGGPGATTVVAVLGPGTSARQITDETGKRFFNADGSENTNPATRIANSMRLRPLIQRPEQGTKPGVPSSFPNIFVFRNAPGKGLTFDLGGRAAQKRFAFFSAGMTFELQAAGAGQLKLHEILRPTRRFELLNAAALQPTQLELVRSQAAGDRLFEVRNLRGLGAQSLLLSPTEDGSQLGVQGAPTLQFDLQLRGPVGQGQQGGLYRNIGLQAGALALVGPANWGNLATSNLAVQLRTLQGNQVRQQLSIPRGQ